MLTTSSDNHIIKNSETKSVSDLNNTVLSEMNAQNGINSSLINNNNNNNNISNNSNEEQHQPNDESNEEPEVDITISNVVSNFSVKCHLNLRQIANNGSNVVYRREQSMILMKIRDPRVTASIWSSGKITCTGATTEDLAKRAARKVARSLQKMGFKVKFNSFRIVNVLGTCILPFGIKIHEFSDQNRANASYEPELHPGATYRMKDIKAVLKIFQTGAITITAPSVQNVQIAVERIYPLVHEYRKAKPPQSKKVSQNNNKKPKEKKKVIKYYR